MLYLTNPNMLYLQSTPLTENLSLLFFIGAVYFFVLFFKRQQRKLLLAASFLSVLGILTRYENWFVFACMGLLLVILSWKERRGFKNFAVDALILGVTPMWRRWPSHSGSTGTQRATPTWTVASNTQIFSRRMEFFSGIPCDPLHRLKFDQL